MKAWWSSSESRAWLTGEMSPPELKQRHYQRLMAIFTNQIISHFGQNAPPHVLEQAINEAKTLAKRQRDDLEHDLELFSFSDWVDSKSASPDREIKPKEAGYVPTQSTTGLDLRRPKMYMAYTISQDRTTGNAQCRALLQALEGRSRNHDLRKLKFGAMKWS